MDPSLPSSVCRTCGAPLPDDPRRDSRNPPLCSGCLGKAGPDGGGNPGEAQAEVTQADLRTTGLTSAGPDAVAGTALPRRFAHYEVTLEAFDDRSPVELGRGAMGVTYLARDTVLDCPVALKVIDAVLSAAHPEARVRFLREAKAAASLRHPNVATVFHYGEQEGHCFYAMELVEGETLEARVRRDGPLPAGLAVEVARQVAHALVAAEARGIVHRDLKPANLMVSASQGSGEGDGDGDGLLVKVIDFGLAKAIVTAGAGWPGEAVDLTHGGFVGTPAYASPEQFADEGKPVDLRSDIYSLGVTLWYLLTGKVPFPGRTIGEIHHRQVHRALPLVQLSQARVPAPVVTLLRGMLDADPRKRPQTARELSGQLRHCREQIALLAPPETTPTAVAPGGELPRPGRHGRLPVIVSVGVLATLAAVAALAFYHLHRPPAPAPGPSPAPAAVVIPSPVVNPEKSVAVLPFENLSDDHANAFFADGVQEEILTNLARVAELKVISRTSVMPYRDAAKRANLPEIARTLGVTHVVLGSVQRAGNKIRVSAQLIDARTDGHRWAERYDRDLADVFALQSEIAERIATSLRARLSPGEKAAIDARPTADLAAYDLYLQARELVAGFQETADWRETLLRAVRRLDEATRRDPSFALAWCLAAQAHDQLYFTGLDSTSLRLALQENAVNTALRLQPDLGEAHLARARLLYRGSRDYEGARRELAIARAALPNTPEVFSLTCYLERRVGRWPEALANQEKAFSLDPKNPSIINDQTITYDVLRLYRREIQVLDTAIKELPGSRNYHRLIKAQALLASGLIDAARGELNALSPGYDPNGIATYARVCAALYGGRPAEAAETLAAFKGTELPWSNGLITPRAWLEALVARAAGDAAGAQTILRSLREDVALAVRQRPDDPFALALLGQVDAALGRKKEALQAGRRAVEMRPASTDAMDGPGLEASLALICAWSGEADEAMRHLLNLQETPGGPDFGQLRDDPVWAPLRERIDYQAMIAQLDPHSTP